MKRNVFLVTMIFLLMTGCSSNNSPDPEEVLKKGIEALHNKNIYDVNRYFDLRDWEDVQKFKAALTDESRHWLPDRLLKIVNTKENSKYSGVIITAIVANRDGEETENDFVLEKTPSGRWKIWYTF